MPPDFQRYRDAYDAGADSGPRVVVVERVPVVVVVRAQRPAK
jgi:hypothetical protein